MPGSEARDARLAYNHYMSAAGHTREDSPEREGAGVLRRLQSRLEAQGYRVTVRLLAPGTVFAPHCACDSRIEAVFSGCLRVVLDGRESLLHPGDWLEISAGMTMSAEVVGDEPVFGMDATRD